MDGMTHRQPKSPARPAMIHYARFGPKSGKSPDEKWVSIHTLRLVRRVALPEVLAEGQAPNMSRTAGLQEIVGQRDVGPKLFSWENPLVLPAFNRSCSASADVPRRSATRPHHVAVVIFFARPWRAISSNLWHTIGALSRSPASNAACGCGDRRTADPEFSTCRCLHFRQTLRRVGRRQVHASETPYRSCPSFCGPWLHSRSSGLLPTSRRLTPP